MIESRLINLIKKITLQTLNTTVQSDYLIGTVISLDPFKIKVNDKMILEEIHFFKLRNAIGTFKTVTKTDKGTYEGYCIHELKEGTKVLLGRCIGGSKYVILGELIE